MTQETLFLPTRAAPPSHADPFGAALASINASDAEPIDKAKARSLMRGYDARYRVRYQAASILAVEHEFRLELPNPATTGKSLSFDLAGKIDALIRESGDIKIVEHKTASDSLEADSSYWDRLAIDTQISMYFLAACEMGIEPTCVVYDVIRKPAIRQTTKETVDDYEKRLSEDVLARPEFYYATREVPRLNSDLVEFVEDAWAWSQQILYFRNRNLWPRNPSACTMFGVCPYLDLCAGRATASDYQPRPRHPELGLSENGRQLITNSRLGALRTCARKHLHMYEQPIERVGYVSAPLEFGRLLHGGLEAWFTCLKNLKEQVQ